MLQGALDRWGGSYYPPSWIAEVYLAMGDKDRAFEWLDKACVEHDYFFQPVERTWNRLRSDPRFEVVRRRINTPAE